MNQDDKNKYIACKDCNNCYYNGKENYCKTINEPIDNISYYLIRYCGDSEKK